MVGGYATEREQIEQIKGWWKDYGAPVIIGVLIALLAGFGWRYLQQRHEKILEHASMRYEQLLTNAVNGNTDAVRAQANRLIERYPHTPYAELAALQLARQDVYQSKLSDAEMRLRWVMKHGDNPALREVARLRVARVLLAENQPQQALDLLQDSDDASFDPAAFEIKGDALLALGRAADARAAYQAALKAFPAFEAVQPLLQMKIDNLAGATNTGAQG
jgi:predicted negative regulator of RcsB-dependent stress response